MLNIVAKKAGAIQALHCGDCGGLLQLGTYQVQFCPACKKAEGGKPLPDGVLCCQECQEPLALDEEDAGWYCIGCNYPPSAQDTLFRKLAG